MGAEMSIYLHKKGEPLGIWKWKTDTWNATDGSEQHNSYWLEEPNAVAEILWFSHSASNELISEFPEIIHYTAKNYNEYDKEHQPQVSNYEILDIKGVDKIIDSYAKKIADANSKLDKIRDLIFDITFNMTLSDLQSNKKALLDSIEAIENYAGYMDTFYYIAEDSREDAEQKAIASGDKVEILKYTRDNIDILKSAIKNLECDITDYTATMDMLQFSVRDIFDSNNDFDDDGKYDIIYCWSN